MEKKLGGSGMPNVKEEQLEQVAGGVRGGAVGVEYVTYNLSTYSSGDTPLYAVGDRVQIKFGGQLVSYRWVGATVLEVSDKATGGLFFKEFVYTVEVDIREGQEEGDAKDIVYGVYESCLKRL